MSVDAVIAHNIRSTHNVGSILRTCDGFGVKKVYFTGYTPYPKQRHDDRLPHLAEKITKQIHKTALGAELSVVSEKAEIIDALEKLKSNDFTIIGLEQNKNSIPLQNYKSPEKIALLLGEELNGITNDLLKFCDQIVEIPMLGQKESFNVSVAAGIALYQLSL
jgi:23S rRNA (guanosine2251-2'-O)-methyltransferase